MHRKQRGQSENNNEAVGLMANGSSGGWEVSVDEATKGPERWFIQLEGPSAYFSFEIPSSETIATALKFLGGGSSPKGAHGRFSPENGSLVLGKYQQTSVILVRDDEYEDRYFLMIGQDTDVVVRYTIAGQDLKDIREALRQASEDIEEIG